MSAPGDDVVTGLRRDLLDQGFRFVEGTAIRALLEQYHPLDDWAEFAGSWNELGPDTYLARRGRERKRRYAAYSVSLEGTIKRAPHQPHYQPLQYNALQGDIDRWFEPVLPATAESNSLRAILEFSRDFFTGLVPGIAAWQLELHQFRIEARYGMPGEPTPEGIHRDGVNYVLVLLVDRVNIAEGTTTIHNEGGQELGHFTLMKPFDAALVDDSRVLHGVTAVTPIDPAKPAHRDVLVVTYRALR